MSDFSRRSLFFLSLGAAATATFGSVQAEDATRSSRVALSGYDPVAYFTDGHPEQGTEQYSAEFDGALYWFKNMEHQSLFNTAPDTYAPQYGGYCAISMSHGKKAEPDPQAWTISDGKLYVFRSLVGVAMFHEGGATIAAAATEHWPELKTVP